MNEIQQLLSYTLMLSPFVIRAAGIAATIMLIAHARKLKKDGKSYKDFNKSLIILIIGCTIYLIIALTLIFLTIVYLIGVVFTLGMLPIMMEETFMEIFMSKIGMYILRAGDIMTLTGFITYGIAHLIQKRKETKS